MTTTAPDPARTSPVGPPPAVRPGTRCGLDRYRRAHAARRGPDPGGRVVHADQAGGLMMLAATVGPETPPVDDVRVLEHAVACAPWMLATLDAVALAGSLRSAATDLRVHHCTLQERIVHAERLLGWSLSQPAGRLRLHRALVLRRLHQTALP